MSTLVIRDFEMKDNVLNKIEENHMLKPFDYFTGFRVEPENIFRGFTTNGYGIYIQEIELEVYYNNQNNQLTYVINVEDM